MTEIDPHPAVSRYPPSKNRSLQAWNAADEHILKYLSQIDIENPSIAVYNDRFGYLSCALHAARPVTVVDYKSSEKALAENFKKNGLNLNRPACINSTLPIPRPIDIGIIKIPKSLNLFRFYLSRLSERLTENSVVICGFMTRHFSPRIPEIGEEYFEDAEQSLAWKKSRLLILKNKKPKKKASAVHSFSHTYTTGITEKVQQYPGVFSAGKVDHATHFLLENVKITEVENYILDIGCGNGIIARDIQLRKPAAEIHLLDDFYLAIESSKLNMDNEHVQFHFDNSCDSLESNYFDVVLSNPPFHFGHETNIEIATAMFLQVHRVLKEGGRFLCVANRHLNYITHLRKIFRQSDTVAQNDKYAIYQVKK